MSKHNYLEIGDIDVGNGSSTSHVVAEEELPANAKIMAKAGDIVVSTVRPYRGAVSVLRENELLVSGAFTVLRQKGSYPPQTLQALFRTDLYKEWLLKYNVGTSYPVIKDDDVLDIPMGHSDISVTMNVYTHIGFDDAEEELKRMEEFRKAQAEVEQKKEKPMSQKMFKAV